TFKDNTGGLSLHFDFSADGQRFLLWGGKALRLYDTKSGKEVAQFVHQKVRPVDKFDVQPGWPYLAKLLPDGNTVAASFYGGSSDVYLLDLPKGKTLHRNPHEHLGYWLAWSPDCKLLIAHAREGSSLGDRAFLLWDVATGKPLRQLRLLHAVTGKE